MRVRDGFPTDRVELTASCDLGRASCEPADSLHGKCVQYFRTLLKGDDERQYAEILAQRVANGAATRWARISAYCRSSSPFSSVRSEEHTSELQSQSNIVCR